jgi:hypothetical protein
MISFGPLLHCGPFPILRDEVRVMWKKIKREGKKKGENLETFLREEGTDNLMINNILTCKSQLPHSKGLN